VFISDEWGARELSNALVRNLAMQKMFDDGHVHPKNVDIFIP